MRSVCELIWLTASDLGRGIGVSMWVSVTMYLEVRATGTDCLVVCSVCGLSVLLVMTLLNSSSVWVEVVVPR